MPPHLNSQCLYFREQIRCRRQRQAHRVCVFCSQVIQFVWIAIFTRRACFGRTLGIFRTHMCTWRANNRIRIDTFVRRCRTDRRRRRRATDVGTTTTLMMLMGGGNSVERHETRRWRQRVAGGLWKRPSSAMQATCYSVWCRRRWRRRRRRCRCR